MRPFSVRPVLRCAASLAFGLLAAANTSAQDIRTRAEAPTPKADTAVGVAPLTPGIYLTVSEVTARRPKYAGMVLDVHNPFPQALTYVDAKGRKRRVDPEDAYAYSDGITLYVRKPNLMRPGKYDGFVRVIVFASLAVAEPIRPRAEVYAQRSTASQGGFQRPQVNMGIGMGTGAWGGPWGGGWGMDPWGMAPVGWGGYGLGPSWGFGGLGGSGVGMNMNVPLNGGRSDGVPNASGEVAIPINPVQELYMVDLHTGKVQSLDAVYLPAFLRTNDAELYEEWVADTRPMHERSKQLHFVRRYNQRHPLKPVTASAS